MNQEIKPVKVGERTYIQRQFIKWKGYWLSCKDQERRKKIFDQLVVLSEMVEKEVRERD